MDAERLFSILLTSLSIVICSCQRNNENVSPENIMNEERCGIIIDNPYEFDFDSWTKSYFSSGFTSEQERFVIDLMVNLKNKVENIPQNGIYFMCSYIDKYETWGYFNFFRKFDRRTSKDIVRYKKCVEELRKSLTEETISIKEQEIYMNEMIYAFNDRQETGRLNSVILPGAFFDDKINGNWVVELFSAVKSKYPDSSRRERKDMVYEYIKNYLLYMYASMFEAADVKNQLLNEK